MKVIETKLKDVHILEPKVFGDNRGYFMETYSRRIFDEYGIQFDPLQDNHSFSASKGTLRGLHYQINPKAQTKIVRVIGGAAFDVVVDVRRESPTYGEWITVELSGENSKQVIIPKGCAHGIMTLTPNTHILYKVDEFYAPQHYHGIIWNDPSLNIDWPIKDPVLSDQDKKLPTLSEAINNF